MTEVIKAKKRASGIELLRIIAMIMIIAHHFFTHVVWGELTGINRYWLNIFGGFGRIGVGIFFIITGYFLFRQKKYNWKKIFNILRPTWFYSLLFLIIFAILKDGRIILSFPLGIYVHKSIFPILSNAYWFISSYVVVSILSPYIKKMLDNLADKELLIFLAVFFGSSFCASLFNAFMSNNALSIASLPIGLFYVMVGYSIGRFEDRIKNKWCIFGLLLSLMLIGIAPFINRFAHAHGYTYPEYLLTDIFAPATIIFSACAFVIFSRFKFSSRIVNYIASLTFGVYLIHENLFVASTIWNTDKVFDVTSHGTDKILNFIVYSIGVTALVFVSCCVVEAIRKLSVNALLFVHNKKKSSKSKE